MNPLKRGVLLGLAGVLGATTIVAVGLAGGGSAAPAATKCTPNPGTYAMEVCATGTFTGKLVASGAASGTVTAAPGTANTLRSFASMAPISGVAVVTFYNADNNPGARLGLVGALEARDLHRPRRHDGQPHVDRLLTVVVNRDHRGFVSPARP
ncbi:hypothetical protein [Actinoplanes sp. NBRC 101535]|uniref:hypothetical protein n=1 Tax=Actinoplanes sp. NBRC 101535 TaxID=3032196 RepID=UPI002555BAEC|nr:hypothetical protein [Actinoplanes sp. NBRC 101535]